MDKMINIDSSIVSEIVKGLFQLLSSANAKRTSKKEDVSFNLSRHLQEIVNWSKKIQFYGMSSGEYTDSSTVSLTFDTMPRKFRGEKKETKKLSEISLLTEEDHLLILGDPGSGKTTTLMRLARYILSNESTDIKDIWQYPLLFRLREIKSEFPFETVIADAIGINYEPNLHDIEGLSRFEKKSNKEHLEPQDIKCKVGDEPLIDFIASFLDSTNGILFLDGLDEATYEHRIAIERTIIHLTRKMQRSKIILTCRSGDYIRPLEGFRIIEICPLEHKQIKEIASKWIKDCEDFLKRLKALPFHDIATRPLFLCQLIVFYRNTGYLPDQPSSVYRRIIRLCLEDWDTQRRVKRVSSYANFDPDQKLEFLSALSYYLTYKIQAKRFHHGDLIAAYKKICNSFLLPPNEGAEVAREIESHTGIIVESGNEYYEFSHLSLQEYLCAYYLVREPFANHFYSYLQYYPSPIAVAVSLSSNPSDWFASIVLKKWPSKAFFDLSTITSLLSRLIIEKPQFNESIFLGIAILKLIFIYGEEIKSYIKDFLQMVAVANSVKIAMEHYRIEDRLDKVDHFRMTQKLQIDNEYGFIIPGGGNIHKEICKMLSSL